MKLEELPTNDVWDGADWGYALAGGTCGTRPVNLDGSDAGDMATERISHVDLFHAQGAFEYADVDMVCLVELVDGSWAGCMAWADSSGWGCRDDASWKVASTRDEAISNALDKAARARLGCPLPGEEVESS